MTLSQVSRIRRFGGNIAHYRDNSSGRRIEMFLPFWQRLLATILAIVVVSYAIGWLWQLVLGFALPSYLAGIIGGLVALPVWHLLKRIRPSRV